MFDDMLEKYFVWSQTMGKEYFENNNVPHKSQHPDQRYWVFFNENDTPSVDGEYIIRVRTLKGDKLIEAYAYYSKERGWYGRYANKKKYSLRLWDDFTRHKEYLI